MDFASLGLSLFSAVVHLYETSVGAYDLYLGVKDFPPSYYKLRRALEIERPRLELWARKRGIHSQSDAEIDQRPRDDALLKLVKDILSDMKAAFEHASRSIEAYDQYAESPQNPTSRDNNDGCIDTLQKRYSSF